MGQAFLIKGGGVKKKPYKIRQIVFHAVSTCHSIVFGSGSYLA